MRAVDSRDLVVEIAEDLSVHWWYRGRYGVGFDELCALLPRARVAAVTADVARTLVRCVERSYERRTLRCNRLHEPDP